MRLQNVAEDLTVIINSVEQNSSSEPNSRLAGENIPCLL
jgi:hypothetical protein